MSWLDNILTGITIAAAGTSLPQEPTLNFEGTGVTVVDDPTNKRITATITAGGSGITALTGAVTASGIGSVAAHVISLDGATPGAADLGFPTGNTLSLSGSDNNTIIDSTFPGFICFGAEDGSGTDGMQLAAANEVFIGSTASDASGQLNLFGKFVFFGDETALSGGDANVRMEFGAVTKIAAREDRGITDFKIGFLGANTTAAAANSHYYSQDGNATNPNGGTTFFYGGAKSGSGLKGGVALSVNGAATETMIQLGEVIAGNRVVSLVQGAVLTATQMPANTGDRVIYIANAGTDATAAPVGGAIFQASAGKLKTVSSNLAMQDIGRSGTVVANCVAPIEQKFVATVHNSSSQTFDFAVPTDRCMHLKARIGLSVLTTGHLSAAGFLQAEGAYENNNGTLNFIAAQTTSSNPMDRTDAAYKAAQLFASDSAFNSMISGEATAVWTISGTNARLTVTTPGGAGDYTVLVDTMAWGSL